MVFIELEMEVSMGSRLFSDTKEKQIAVQYEKGSSLKTLAERHGCNLVTIRNVLIRQGVRTRRRGGVIRSFSKRDVRKMAWMWEEGQSQTAIAEAFSTSQSVISRVLRLHGFTVEKRQPRRETHGNWNGGRVTFGTDYVYVLVNADDDIGRAMMISTGYVAEHRLVMAHHIGRSLLKSETVHHINGDKTDNRIENLQLRVGNHGKGVAMVCADCGSKNIVTSGID